MLYETHRRFRAGEHFLTVFPTENCSKYVDNLLPLLFNTALLYAIRRVRVNQDGLKLNGTHRFLFYANYVNILDGSLHIIKKTIVGLLVGSKEIGLEVNVDKN